MSVYPDRPGLGRRIRRPLQRHTPPDVEVNDAQTRCILEVAAKHPRFTPEEVHAVIRHDRRRDDITKDIVRHVLDADR